MAARRIAALATVLLLGACAVTPQPLSHQDQVRRAESDRAHLFQDQEPLSGPVTLPEAVARAIKYNLDHRLTAMEQALQSRQLDVSRYDLLPKLVAGAGATMRNNESASSSISVQTRRTSLEASTSQDKERVTADLGLSWNVLDFGVSYYQARQQADRSLIAGERRRKTIHGIVQQVRAAYWQVAAAQRAGGTVARVLEEARQALADSEKSEAELLMAPLEALRYQKALIEIVRQLEDLSEEMAVAKAQLTALMNLPPGTEFQVALPPEEVLAPPKPPLGLAEMEKVALVQRPELREESYQKRVDAHEVRKAMVRMLPGLNLNSSLNVDSNSFLVDNSWAEAGLRVSWNLLSLLSGPAGIRLAETQQEVGEARRLALSMAVLTQVHVGFRQYRRTLQHYEQSRRLDDIEQRIYQNVINAETTEAAGALERVRSAASAVVTGLQRHRAFADLQNATAALYVSLGLDPLPEQVEGHDLPTLTQAVGKTLIDWENGRVRLPEVEPPAPVPVPSAEAQPPAPAPTASAEPPAPAPAPPAPVGPFARAPASAFGVQIAVYANADAALHGWPKLVRTEPDLAHWTPVLMEEPKSKGEPWQRLVLTGFASPEEARNFCVALTRRGRGCLLRQDLAVAPAAGDGAAS